MIIVTPGKREYSFDSSNEYSVVPDTWADLYFILSFDKNIESNNRNFVFAKDEASKTNERRIFVEQEFEPVDQSVELERIAKANKEKELDIYRKQYRSNVEYKIAIGVIEELPEEEQIVKESEEYAQNKWNELHPEVVTEENKEEAPFVREVAMDFLTKNSVGFTKNISNVKLKELVEETEAKIKANEKALADAKAEAEKNLQENTGATVQSDTEPPKDPED